MDAGRSPSNAKPAILKAIFYFFELYWNIDMKRFHKLSLGFLCLSLPRVNPASNRKHQRDSSFCRVPFYRADACSIVAC